MIAKNKPRNNRKQSQIANRLRVLRLIYSTTPYSQRRIALETELQASTVSNIISEFLKIGIIVEGESLERSKVGPRETVLHINPQRATTIGLNIHATTQDICIIGGDGTILAEKRISTKWDSKTPAKLASSIKALVKETGLAMDQIKGAGIAIPGVVDNESGVTILSRALQVENYPIRARMSDLLEMPVMIDRNVNYGGYLEQYLNPTLKQENTGYLLISKIDSRRSNDEYSVGMSLTLNGEIYRGTNHAAGELDAVLLPSNDGSAADDAEPFFCKMGNHFASVINLLDIGHLIVSSEAQTLAEEDFGRFSKALHESLIPISQRRFQLSLSPYGIRGITRGAALHVLHHCLEAELGETILNRGK